MLFRQLFDRETSTYTYLIADRATRRAALVDAVQEHLERDVQLLEDLGLELVYTLETHVHADHVTASGRLRERLGSTSVLSAAAGAGCPDILVQDGDVLELGDVRVEARHTPGHTSGCVTYVVTAPNEPSPIAFTGDALLIRGCGRTDFQQGDARTLYRSVHERIFSLPPETRIFPGHDYQGRTMSTVEEERALNPRLGGDRTEDDFVKTMAALKLAYPKRIDEAVPANMSCGIGPGAEAPLDDGIAEVDAAWVRSQAESLRRIDVRQPDELDGPLGAMAGAENVPLDRLEEVAREWPERGDPVVLVCRSGVRSRVAAQRLAGLGFTRVASMRGGMEAWRASEVPNVQSADGG